MDQKFVFLKMIPNHLGDPKQVKCAHFETMVNHFDPSGVTKCLENGLFWGTTSQTCVLPKNNLGPFGVFKQAK